MPKTPLAVLKEVRARPIPSQTERWPWSGNCAKSALPRIRPAGRRCRIRKRDDADPVNAPYLLLMRREWPNGEVSRVPFWLYSDPDIYQRELERFFHSGHWCYVGLAAEIPSAGDFKRSWIGERSVVVVRNHDGAVHVVENRCAHRGVAFCQQNFGNRRDFVCPYHQWNYDLTGNLIGFHCAAASRTKARSKAECRRISPRTNMG